MRVEVGAEQAAPVLADVAQLAGERRRMGARGRPQELDQGLAVGPDRGQVRLVGLERGDRLRRGLGGERRVVDEVAEGPRGRVLVGEPEQEQLFQPSGRRAVVDVGELLGDGVEHVVEHGLADGGLDHVGR